MGDKFIFVTGGVISGLGKGIAAASIGHLLSYDYNVIPIKCDGYLNVDPGTMNPIEHGEVFVLDDGAEVDMDFGHYERFLDINCSEQQSITMGKIFRDIRRKERAGDYKGKTVQMMPHGADIILDNWKNLAKKGDVTIIEIGGTVGDMESELYIEAARRLRSELGSKKVMFVHLTYIPIPEWLNEQKSKPTQQSVSLLMQRGIIPDMILCRTKVQVTDKIKEKISLFCNIHKDAVISALDTDNVYKIPLIFQEQNVLNIINKKLGLKARPKLDKWKKMVCNNKHSEINVAICGKYTSLEDSYASVIEALRHSCNFENVKLKVTWIDTEKLENKKVDVSNELKGVDAVIVPGGFGSRGIEGKINIIKYCRENNVPFLGICYGLQLAVVEFSRNVCGLKDAHTTEIRKTKNPVIDILPEKKDLKDIGGTLRLGSQNAVIKKNTLVYSLYKKSVVSERHRHRYEVNPEYHSLLEKNGLVISGLSPDKRLAEFIELKEHVYFVATQAHPELKSKPLKPAPLFLGLVKAGLKKHKNV